jgi:hypothetical protein
MLPITPSITTAVVPRTMTKACSGVALSGKTATFHRQKLKVERYIGKWPTDEAQYRNPVFGEPDIDAWGGHGRFGAPLKR